MAPSPRHSRASSVPSSPTRPPTKISSTLTRTPTHSSASHAPDQVAKRASLLQPRVAVVLNVPPPWHPWLFALRLFSILPAIWWGTPSILQLLLRVLELVVKQRHGSAGDSVDYDRDAVPVTEMTLAVIWCFASGYLSFFFTDCLMSRWLINYTPQATMVRLLTINAINAYVTSAVLYLAGGFSDSRLLLPGWIGIATTLTVCYHITHQKINIRKETSTSINVFSIASYISMITLLVHMHRHQADYPAMPLVLRARDAWDKTHKVAVEIRDYLEQYKDL